MAGIGMFHMVAAPITSYTPGSAPVYGNGFLVGPAVEANVSFNTNDNPDMGDDEIQDNDNGVNGYSGSMENNFLEEEIAAKLYGWGGAGTSQSPYVITDGAAPEHGWGYLKKCLNKGVLKFRAFWFTRAQFTMGSYANAKTKPKNGVEWQHDTTNINGMGVYEDSSGKQHFVYPKTFTSMSDAEAWLDTWANISSSSSSSGTT